MLWIVYVLGCCLGGFGLAFCLATEIDASVIGAGAFLSSLPITIAAGIALLNKGGT